MIDTEQNKAKVRQFYERSDSGDLSVYEEMIAADFVNHGGPAGELHGPEEYLMVAEGDYVVAYGVATGTHEGPFLGLPPTGKQLRWTGVATYQFDAEGKILGRWQEIDGLGLFGRLGLIPPPPGGPGGPQ